MTTLDKPVQSPDAVNVHERLSHHILTDGYPVVLDLEKSHGPYLHDAKSGRDLLDFFTSFSTVPIGYNHPGLKEPAFLERLMAAAINKPANSDLYTPEFAGFVEAFARTVPDELNQHLFFVSGGALAVENALKAAFDWKHRKNIAANRAKKGSMVIHFHEAFHGRSGYTLSLTNTDPRKTDFFPKFEHWPRIINPKLTFPETEEGLSTTLALEQQAVSEIERAVDRYGHDIAALILEPIQGEGGDNHFRPEFLQELRHLADEHEFLLVFDEVQTGFGTTGKWWCFEHMDVLPDIFAFGKKTQTCGIAASRRLDEVDSVFEVSSRINSTWGGNLVDMVRCHRVIEVIEEEDLLKRAARSGEQLLAGLRDMETRFIGMNNSRGLGLFLAFDLPDGKTRNRMLGELRDGGLMGLASGERSIRFRPSLIIDDKHVAEGLEKLETVLKKHL